MSINTDSMHINSTLYKIVEDQEPVSCTCRRISNCDHQDRFTTIRKAIPVTQEEATELKSKGQNLYRINDSGKFVLHEGKISSSSSQSKQSHLPAQETAKKVEKCTSRKFCDCPNCSGMW